MVAALVFARDAQAKNPVEAEVTGKVGYATSTQSSGPTPLGFGVGARGGISIFNVYAGLSFMYYFGGTSNQNLPDGDTVSTTSILYGIESGYNLNVLDNLTIRPQLGVGNLSVTPTLAGPVRRAGAVRAIQGSSYWYLEGGVTALATAGLLLISADVGVLGLPSLHDSNAALEANVQVGVKF